jgi:NAD-dependent deacetylase
MEDLLNQAIKLIKEAKRISAFTGAGISVESGIPAFRGSDGLWSKYDPKVLDINYFYANPEKSWIAIKEIFYDFFGSAKPNDAHHGLAKLEEKGLLKEIITQNIDNLHQRAGSKIIYEFHGNSQKLVCTSCSKQYGAEEISLETLPPSCPSCDSLLKPDFVFFGEGIPAEPYQNSVHAAENSDLFIVIGTTGEVMPACYIPRQAKENGAKIIEINTEHSAFTNSITDIYLQGKASEIMNQLLKNL